MPSAARLRIDLNVGQALPRRDQPCQAWRVVSGLLCLGPTHPLQACAAVYGLAAPGDLVGLPAAPADACAWALVPCVLQAWDGPATPHEWPAVLQRLCTQHWRQAAERAQLRSGSVRDVLMLGNQQNLLIGEIAVVQAVANG